MTELMKVKDELNISKALVQETQIKETYLEKEKSLLQSSIESLTLEKEKLQAKSLAAAAEPDF